MSIRTSWKTPRTRFSVLPSAVLLAVVVTGGCGSKSEPAATALNESPVTETLTSDPQADANACESVVSQFLDRVRRGGVENTAMQLLTRRAQSELTRIGHQIQPIGSPDARYTITRSQPAPYTEPGTSRLVHTLWTEPFVDPASGIRGEREYQVVWAVNRESDAWRISGLVLAENPEAAPIVLDFENGDQMAQFMNPAPSVSPEAVANGQNAPGPANPTASTARQPSTGGFDPSLNR
ncbi:MAG: hypothetical protein AAGD07_19270 [Planctomycetota bacterium]